MLLMLLGVLCMFGQHCTRTPLHHVQRQQNRAHTAQITATITAKAFLCGAAAAKKSTTRTATRSGTATSVRAKAYRLSGAHTKPIQYPMPPLLCVTWRLISGVIPTLSPSDSLLTGNTCTFRPRGPRFESREGRRYTVAETRFNRTNCSIPTCSMQDITAVQDGQCLISCCSQWQFAHPPRSPVRAPAVLASPRGLPWAWAAQHLPQAVPPLWPRWRQHP